MEVFPFLLRQLGMSLLFSPPLANFYRRWKQWANINVLRFKEETTSKAIIKYMTSRGKYPSSKCSLTFLLTKPTKYKITLRNTMIP